MAYKINNQGGIGILDDKSVVFRSITATSVRGNSVKSSVGLSTGYTSGGYTTPPYTDRNTIEKFPFAADANATDSGDLTQARSHSAGQSSDANGYTSGGAVGSLNVIDKFLFGTDADATDVGDLSQGRYYQSGQSSDANGYSAGGLTPGYTNVIDKFPFSSDANATDVGDMTNNRGYLTGQSSTTHGYISGGYGPPFGPPFFFTGAKSNIEKFPFSSDNNASGVGFLTGSRYVLAGQSSTTDGYSSGGGYSSPFSPFSALNNIDNFPFSSDANATDVGDLTQARWAAAGQSSNTHGYTSGGAGGFFDVIDKFSFSSTGNATDVGDLSQGRIGVAGQQG